MPARSPCISTVVSRFSSSLSSGCRQLLWLKGAEKLPTRMPPCCPAGSSLGALGDPAAWYTPTAARSRLAPRVGKESERNDSVRIKTCLLIPKEFRFGFCLSHLSSSHFQPSPGKRSPMRCPKVFLPFRRAALLAIPFSLCSAPFRSATRTIRFQTTRRTGFWKSGSKTK